MKKKIVNFCMASMLSLVGASSVYAVAMVDDSIPTEQQEAGNSYLNGDLKGRYRDGRLDTSLGEYQVAADVEVEDRRPMGQWFDVPADAKIQLELDDDHLIRVIIY